VEDVGAVAQVAGDEVSHQLVYLAGPINGCTDAECRDWREAAKAVFPLALDPMRRDYRGREDAACREIVGLDKMDILFADVVLVNYVKPSVGTAMEILFAWENRKPVVLWCASGEPLSPWLRYHSTVIVHSFADALEAVREIKGIGDA
jgi:nucleoside 2-deoxyribosyltransferase